METYKVIDENTVEVGGDRYVFKNKNCTGCGSCGLYPFFFDCIKDKRIKCVQKSLATVGKYGYTSLERWGVFVKETKSNNINMEKERKITAPEGHEIEKVELIDGAVVVTFREKMPNFKEGDIVFTSSTASSEIFIFKEISDDGFVQCFCSYDSEDKFINGEKHCIGKINGFYRFATPEEVLKLLNLIDKYGYVWDAENLELRKKERQLPKSWEEFCEMFPIKEGESYIDEISVVVERDDDLDRLPDCDKSCLPDRATAEAVLALCQLIQLRDCYNGDWVPDWDNNETKYTIEFSHNGNIRLRWSVVAQCSILFFKSEELRDEFLSNFRPLIEKLKPLYGIKTESQQ